MHDNNTTPSDLPNESLPLQNDENASKQLIGHGEPMWINNNGEEVNQVFGFSENAELVNGRAAMVGFIMLLVTEFVFGGAPAIHTLFGIGPS